MNSPIFRIRLAESQEEQAIAKHFAFHANVTRMSSFVKVSNKESMTSFEPMIYDVRRSYILCFRGLAFNI